MLAAEQMVKTDHSQRAQARVTPNPYTYVPPSVEKPPVATKITLPDDGVLSGERATEQKPATTTSAPVNDTAAQAPRTENKESLYTALKQYGIDPYREPAE